MQFFLVIVIMASFLNLNDVNSSPSPRLNSNYEDIDPYNMPASCKGKKYCTVKHDENSEDDEYPQNDVNELVMKVSRGTDNNLSYNDSLIKSIEHSEFTDVEPDCKADHKTVPIYYIMDQKNKTRIVVQSGSGLFNQTFEVRKCPKDGPVSQSNIFLNTSGVHVSCNTTYLLFDFYVLNVGITVDLDMEVIQAELPVCCKCTYL